MPRSLKPINFHAPLGQESEHGDFVVYHAYVPVNHWPAGQVSDNINPRSHDDNVLGSPVAQAIRMTLEEDPVNFVLKNRGILLLADRVRFDPATRKATVLFDGDSRLRGLADGGTTDAVIAAIPKPPKEAQVHVEIVVGLNDPDRVAKLVEGRNTSRQVRSVSLVHAAGRLDWLKAAVPPPVRGRIAWEENAGGAPVSDLLGLVAMFRPGLGRPLVERTRISERELHQRLGEHDAWVMKLSTCYRDRSKLAASLRDDKVLADFEKVAPLVPMMLRVHDEGYRRLAVLAEERSNKTRSGRIAAVWDRAFPPDTTVDAMSPYFEFICKRRVPVGWLFPVLATFRLFAADGKWTLSEEELIGGKGKDESILDMAVRRIPEHVTSGMTADKFAKTGMYYALISSQVMNERRKKG